MMVTSGAASAAAPTRPDFQNVKIGGVKIGGFLNRGTYDLFADRPLGSDAGYASLATAKRAAAKLSAGNLPAVALFESEGRYFANEVWRKDAWLNVNPVVEPLRFGAYGEKGYKLSNIEGFVGIFDGERAVMHLSA